MGIAMLNRIFGYDSGDMSRAQFAQMHADFMKVISHDFVNETAAIATLDRGCIGAKVSVLISFTEDSTLQNLWEKSTNLKVLAEDDRRRPVAEVDFDKLLKIFSFCLAVPLLYGHDYLERSSSVLEDWEVFSKHAVPLLALGMPTWIPIKSFQEGPEARGRLYESLKSVPPCETTFPRGGCRRVR